MCRFFTAFLIFMALLVFSKAGTAQQEGTRRYNRDTRKMEFFDGNHWYNFQIGLPLGGCTTEGAMDFNETLSLYQYCNGTSWIRLVGIPMLSFCSEKAAMDYIGNSYFYCNGLVWSNMKGLIIVSGLE